MATSLGLHAPSLDAVRALKTGPGRRERGRFAVDGVVMLREALEAGRRPETVYVTAAGLVALGTLAGDLDDRTVVVPDRAMDRMSDLDSPPGVLAVFAIAFAPLERALAAGEPALVLAGVSDPGNAGTLVRSADIFDIRTAIFVGGADPYAPKVVRATMGAVFRCAYVETSAESLATAARDLGYRIVAGARDGTPLGDYRFVRRTLLAIGNERRGVAEVLPHVDATVTIPQSGRGESLNAAVAGGIIFYAFSQHSRVMISEHQSCEKP